MIKVARPSIHLATLQFLAALIVLVAGGASGWAPSSPADAALHAHHALTVVHSEPAEVAAAVRHDPLSPSAAHPAAHGGCVDCEDCGDHGGCLVELYEGERSHVVTRLAASLRIGIYAVAARGRALDPARRPPRLS